MSALGHPPLVAHLRNILQAEGSIPFDRFMQASLYEPGLGYYSRSQGDPGRRGDFFTSVSVGAVFGCLLADHIVGLWSRSFPATPLLMIEQGAHGGRMALDILNALQEKYPVSYASCNYWCLEPLPGLRTQQEKTLAPHQNHVRVLADWPETEDRVDRAFFLSNELLDSFPVSLVCNRQGGWKECRVSWDGQEGKFRKEWQIAADPRLLHEISHWRIPALDGYQAEICPGARSWIQKLCQRLAAGFILTIDYGFLAPDLYSNSRPQGTLMCYSGHRRDEDPLVDVGEKDITAHVNFSLLMEEADKASWETVYFQDQHHALVDIAKDRFLPELEQKMTKNSKDTAAQAEIRQFQTLIHPGIMGTQFKFLLQSRKLL